MSKRVLAILVALHALAAWIFLAPAGPGFPLDDTWLHLVYARGVRLSGGFAYNPGELETGVTAPLWTLALVVPVWVADALGARPDLGVRLLGGLCGLAMAVVGYRLASRAGRWPAYAAALALSLDPLLVFERFSGLEQPLFGLLLLLLVQALVDEKETRCGLLCGLLVLTRPEALVPTVLTGAWLVHRRRRILRFAGPVLLCLLPWVAYLLAVSGRPWPSTVESKAMAVFDPRVLGPSVAALFGDTGWGWALPLCALVGIYTLEGGQRHLGTLLLGLSLPLLAAVLLTRPLPTHGDPARVPYYWQRYALLAWPALVLVASAGMASLVRTAWAGLRCRPLYAVALIGPLLVVLAAGRELPAHARELRQRFREQCEDIEAMQVSAALWVRDELPPEALVAAHDAGALRFFGGHRVLDVHGEHCLELMAQDRAGGPDQALRWLRRQRPDAFVGLPALWAAGHSPELKRMWREMPAQEYAARRAMASDYAEFLGLTRRAVTFHVDEPATVPDPFHEDLAVFVRP